MTNYTSSLKDLGLENKHFTKKGDIKPWLLKHLCETRGFDIVIERSDDGKIIFKCKNGKEKCKSQGNIRRKIICPFKIRANFSIKNQMWSLVILNQQHSHEIIDLSSVPITNSEDITISNSELPSVYNDLNKSCDDTLPYLISNIPVDDKTSSSSSSSQRETRKRKLGGNKRRTSKRELGRKRNKRSTQEQNILTLQPDFTYEDIIMSLSDNINSLIRKRLYTNQMINDDSKQSIVKSLVDNILQEFKKNTDTNDPNLMKSTLNAWMSTSPSQTGISHNHSANLIPLSPLLNDSENDYHNEAAVAAAAAAGGTHSPSPTHHHTSIDSFNQLPGVNSNIVTSGSSSINFSNANNFVIPGQIQLLQIQNQNQQLPSFNSIQNNLPFSPTSMATSSSGSFFNSHNSSSVLPFNNTNTNTNTNTLNPSYLLKSEVSKNPLNHNGINLLNQELKSSSDKSLNSYLGNMINSAVLSSPVAQNQVKSPPSVREDLTYKIREDNE